MRKFFFTAFVLCLLAACNSAPKVSEWVSTTYDSPWQEQAVGAVIEGEATDVITIDLTKTDQTIEGFGSCFNELGWTSLSLLDEQTREGIFEELFAPGVGANFTVCRMSPGSNDFALDYYSFDDVEGDFEMEHFSVEHDTATIIPFVKAALAKNPDLRLWASPWCPPTWMKVNKHYASRSTTALARMMEQMRARDGGNGRQAGEESFFFRVVDNGLPEDKQTLEGTDAFITEDAYFAAYALYFKKFIEAYRTYGINVFAVMPQNEFNSDQPYPSCVWTLPSLATFMGKYLGPAMEEVGVELMYGTIERAREEMIDVVMDDSDCAKYITGMAFQWAGKDALPYARSKYPSLRYIQSEQECGNGRNDWAGASHSFDLMLHYLGNGVSVYEYWNTSLLEGGVSRWGWAQNSLVTVNETDRTFKYTPEYYVLKHASHYVMPGAVRIVLEDSYPDALCFRNPDKSIIVLAANKSETPKEVGISLGGKTHVVTLPAESVNTIVLK